MATPTVDARDSQPLYSYGGEMLFPQTFSRALASLGVQAGDTALVHSDVGVFGRLACYDREFVLGAIVDLLKGAVQPQGRLVMPTFSYSFCQGEPFDPAKSRSTVGALTEYFRLRPGVVRSRHPIFSFAVDAPDAAAFARVGKDAFGAESMFAKLHSEGGKIVAFGSQLEHSATFLHYVEQTRGVDYRYFKTFTGEIVDETGTHNDSCTYYVRDLVRNPLLDLSRLHRRLLDAGHMKEARVGGGTIAVVPCKAVFDETNRLLDEDPYGLLQRPV